MGLVTKHTSEKFFLSLLQMVIPQGGANSGLIWVIDGVRLIFDPVVQRLKIIEVHDLGKLKLR